MCVCVCVCVYLSLVMCHGWIREGGKGGGGSPSPFQGQGTPFPNQFFLKNSNVNIPIQAIQSTGQLHANLCSSFIKIIYNQSLILMNFTSVDLNNMFRPLPVVSAESLLLDSQCTQYSTPLTTKAFHNM